MLYITIQPTTYGNTTIDHGILSGVDWYKYGDTPNIPPTCQQVVEFIKDNMIEPAREGFLDDERLADNAGFLVGWILTEEQLRQDVGIVVGVVSCNL